MRVQTVSYKDPKASQKFTQSLRETGFAVLADHPIAHGLIEETYGEWEKFFASEKKHEYTFKQENQLGYFPFRTEKAKNYGFSDLKEFFHYYPARMELPSNTREFTPKLYRELYGLGLELLQWVEDFTPAPIREKLSMPLVKMVEGAGDTLLRPIHYPPLTGSEEQGAVRAAAHEDINLITLLPAATAPGLEVRDLAGNWHAVEINPGQLAINAGDMLQMCTERHYISTTHRVVNPKGPAAKLPRFSMPLFLHPDGEVRLSEQHTARTYLQERLREIGLLKK